MSGSITIKETESVTISLLTRKPDGFIEMLQVLKLYRQSFRKMIKWRLLTSVYGSHITSIPKPENSAKKQSYCQFHSRTRFLKILIKVANKLNLAIYEEHKIITLSWVSPGIQGQFNVGKFSY